MRYVHGYSSRESERLQDQSNILEKLLHDGTTYAPNSNVLEAGCGVGAQTRLLAKRNSGAQIIAIDISEKSLVEARKLIKTEKLSNVEFKQENITEMSFCDETFDHIFICFVLEHLEQPLSALEELKRVLKTGGSITVIEGDHGSCFWHPETNESLAAWNSLIKAQLSLNNDPLIGRQLYPLLKKAEYKIKYSSPRWVYADDSNPVLLDGVVNRIIVPMVESAKEQVLSSSIVKQDVWEKGINDLRQVGSKPDGTFFYTWFKALAYK